MQPSQPTRKMGRDWYFRGKTYIPNGRNHPCHPTAAAVCGVARHEATQGLSGRHDAARRRRRRARNPAKPTRGRGVLRAPAPASRRSGNDRQAPANVARCDEPHRQALVQRSRRRQRRRRLVLQPGFFLQRRIAPHEVVWAALCAWLAVTGALTACTALPSDATLPLGAHTPRSESFALANPERTKLGKRIEPRVREHPDMSGFRLIASGVECFRARMEMAALAEKTLDVQYFAIQSDDTGRLFIQGLLDAADRGVRVRILLDDSNAVGRDAEIGALTAHRNIELRVFNPFS